MFTPGAASDMEVMTSAAAPSRAVSPCRNWRSTGTLDVPRIMSTWRSPKSEADLEMVSAIRVISWLLEAMPSSKLDFATITIRADCISSTTPPMMTSMAVRMLCETMSAFSLVR